LQKLLQKVYWHVFYGPQCRTLRVTLCLSLPLSICVLYSLKDKTTLLVENREFELVERCAVMFYSHSRS